MPFLQNICAVFTKHHFCDSVTRIFVYMGLYNAYNMTSEFDDYKEKSKCELK